MHLCALCYAAPSTVLRAAKRTRNTVHSPHDRTHTLTHSRSLSIYCGPACDASGRRRRRRGAQGDIPNYYGYDTAALCAVFLYIDRTQRARAYVQRPVARLSNTIYIVIEGLQYILHYVEYTVVEYIEYILQYRAMYRGPINHIL